MPPEHRLLFQHQDGTIITREQLEDIITVSVSRVVERKCRFPISDEHANETAHLFGMYTDLGDGDMSKGIEECRQNHSYVKKIRAKSDKFSTYFFMVVIAALTGGILKTVWEGIKNIVTVK